MDTVHRLLKRQEERIKILVQTIKTLEEIVELKDEQIKLLEEQDNDS